MHVLSDIAPFRKILQERTGLSVPETHVKAFKKAVNQRCADLPCSPDEYLKVLRKDPEEFDLFIEGATIGETYFFREARHFNAIKEYVLPSRKESPGIKCWSVTCATGEEAVSLAVLLKETAGTKERCVFATDINRTAVERMKRGEFSRKSFREDGKEFHPLLMKNGVMHQKTFTVHRDIMEMIRPEQKNIFSGDLSAYPDFDIIMFRNTLIYMDAAHKQKVMERITEKMKTGGHLFLSATESSIIQHPSLEIVESESTFFFRKIKKAALSVTHDLPATEKRAASMSAGSEHRNLSLNREEVMSLAREIQEQEGKGVHNSSPEYVFAELLNYILYYINRMNFDTALSLLEIYTSAMKQDEYTEFLMGYIKMSDCDNISALSHFRRSRSRNSGFWPSSFYLGLVLKDESPRRAVLEFQHCMETIRKTPENEKEKYTFLLGNYSEEYFLEMSKRWAKQLERK